uniref:NTF2 domain-containing protein n=1 Tax=Latimeria chalumnae TaxID=7897 RepID=M3XJL1_LATCH|nr:PREDICTED: uncharacterized protein C3orf38-like [Latimeria chalumnae]|eukprot:XP_014349617.1 PREDICTED: uncharacterized protein C3orf38-like [Latimeria chalumnae]
MFKSTVAFSFQSAQVPQVSVESITTTAVTLNVPSQNLVQNVTLAADCLSVLGKEFCQWFYKCLNSQNPSSIEPRSEWNKNYFWKDATYTFNFNGPHQRLEKYNGAATVSSRLARLVQQEAISFIPETESNCLRCVNSSQGTVVVGVAGTVCKGSSCLGIFEQVFQLIRTTIESSYWIIKHVHLNIQAQENYPQSGMLIPKPQLQYQDNELQVFFHSVENS